jgi:hypothetical protein
MLAAVANKQCDALILDTGILQYGALTEMHPFWRALQHACPPTTLL